MKITNYIIMLIAFSLFFSCSDKKTTPDKVDDPSDSYLDKPDKDEVEVDKEKTPVPPLPDWVKMPVKKASSIEIASKVNTIVIYFDDDNSMKLKPPYKIFQTGAIFESIEQVLMPVIIEKDNYWLKGNVNAFQVDVKIPGGTKLYDKPKGVEVGFISKPINVVVKKLNGNWALISYTLNDKCSPAFLKVWIKKSIIMQADKSAIVKFPNKYTKKLPKRDLVKNASLFEVFGRNRAGDMILQLPLCKVNDQVLKVGRRLRGRTRLFFKPSANSPFAILGWMPNNIAGGKRLGTCSCKRDSGKKSYTKPYVEQMDYKTRVELPIYLAPKTNSMVIGVLKVSSIKKYEQYIKNRKFGRVETGTGLEFYVPFNDNYFLP